MQLSRSLSAILAAAYLSLAGGVRAQVSSAQTSPSTNFAATVLAAGPSAYWRLNEIDSHKLRDLAGGNDGMSHNLMPGPAGLAPPLTFVGLSNNSPHFFNGSNAFIRTPLSLSGNQGTFVALVNPADTQVGAAAICVARGSGANVCALDMENDGVDVQYVWANEPGTWDFNPGFAPPAGQWSFVAVSVSPSNAVMYLDSGDGLAAATNIYSHRSVSAAGPVVIGGDPVFGQRWFKGALAEVAVFNRALTGAEIAAIDKLAGISNVTQNTFTFEPVRYRPLPVMTAGLATNCLLLDGEWELNPAPGSNALSISLSDSNWARFRVPGQWK